MAEMPISVPLKIKIKGLAKGFADILLRQDALATLVSTLHGEWLSLDGKVDDIQTRLGTLVTNVERIGASLTGIAADIARLKQSNTDQAAADAATIAQLRSDLEAAGTQAGLDSAQIATLTSTVDTLEASLADSRATFDAELNPLAERAAALDAENPEPATEPETPAEPTEPTPEPVPDEPAPPVDEPAPVEPTPDVPVEEPAPVEPSEPAPVEPSDGSGSGAGIPNP